MKTLDKNIITLKSIFFSVFALTVLTACSDDSHDTDVPLSAIPSNVISIIQSTLPGISLTAAEKELKDNTVVYELVGKLINGKEYEIKITEGGTILKIELED